MANLIITIISIALVAVAALMGAYYGGQAFLEGQRKAKINAIISQANQIAGAWQTYAVNNAGNSSIAGGLPGLSPAYLSEVPVPPESNVTISTGSELWNKWGVMDLSNDNTASMGAATGTPRYLVMVTSSQQICLDINLMGGTFSSVNAYFKAGTSLTASVGAGGSKFGCITYWTGPEYVIYYRVF